jgi:hypothetical protein
VPEASTKCDAVLECGKAGANFECLTRELAISKQISFLCLSGSSFKNVAGGEWSRISEWLGGKFTSSTNERLKASIDDSAELDRPGFPALIHFVRGLGCRFSAEGF